LQVPPIEKALVAGEKKVDVTLSTFHSSPEPAVTDNPPPSDPLTE
jgi:hypothetical protein